MRARILISGFLALMAISCTQSASLEKRVDEFINQTLATERGNRHASRDVTIKSKIKGYVLFLTPYSLPSSKNRLKIINAVNDEKLADVIIAKARSFGDERYMIVFYDSMSGAASSRPMNELAVEGDFGIFPIINDSMVIRFKNGIVSEVNAVTGRKD